VLLTATDPEGTGSCVGQDTWRKRKKIKRRRVKC